MTHKKDSADKLNHMLLIVQFANNDKRDADHNSQRLFLVMELRGVEPLSERPTPQASTSVVYVFISSDVLPQTGLHQTSQVKFPICYPTLAHR